MNTAWSKVVCTWMICFAINISFFIFQFLSKKKCNLFSTKLIFMLNNVHLHIFCVNCTNLSFGFVVSSIELQFLSCIKNRWTNLLLLLNCMKFYCKNKYETQRLRNTQQSITFWWVCFKPSWWGKRGKFAILIQEG